MLKFVIDEDIPVLQESPFKLWLCRIYRVIINSLIKRNCIKVLAK